MAAGMQVSSALPQDSAPRKVAPCQNRLTALWGLCRADGSDGPPVVEQKYLSIGPGGTGSESQVFPARLAAGDLSGYLNAEGGWAIQPRFPVAMPFSDGLAVVSDGSNAAAIDAAGVISVPWFEGLLFPFREGLACSVPRGSIRLTILGEWRKRWFGGDETSYSAAWWRLLGKTGFVDKSGKMVIPAQFEPKLNYLFASCGFNAMGYAAMRFDGRDGLIDRQGKWVIQPQFDYLGMVFSGNRKILALVAEHNIKKGILLDSVERLDGAVDSKGNVSWRDAAPAREVPVAGGLARTFVNLILFPKWQQDLLNDDISFSTLIAWAGSLCMGAVAAASLLRRASLKKSGRILYFGMSACLTVVTVVVTFLLGVLSLYATAVLGVAFALMAWRSWRMPAH